MNEAWKPPSAQPPIGPRPISGLRERCGVVGTSGFPQGEERSKTGPRASAKPLGGWTCGAGSRRDPVGVGSGNDRAGQGQTAVRPGSDRDWLPRRAPLPKDRGGDERDDQADRKRFQEGDRRIEERLVVQLFE